MAKADVVVPSEAKRPFRRNISAEGDAVIVTYCKNEVQLIKLRRDAITRNKCGVIKHNDIIGKPYGSRIATSLGRVNILALDPVIWAMSLPHRTQIIYPTDASMIVGQLDLVPGCRVLEAGTGSGALTHALAQAVWPTGHVSTFDFHEERVERARVEFEEHGLQEVVSQQCRDVLTEGFPVVGSKQNPDGCHAIMIDLPEPWTVIPKSAQCFSPSGGRVCVFSPCIEQVQKTCANLRSAGFSEVEVIECVSRTYDPCYITLNVPNLGQKNATDLFNGDYTYPMAKTITASNTDSGESQGSSSCVGQHLFPPLSKYLTPNERSDGRLCKQGGYWGVLPKSKDTGHTGYLTFASIIPMKAPVKCDSLCDIDDD